MWGVWGCKVCLMLYRRVKTLWRASRHTSMAFAAFLERQRYPIVYQVIVSNTLPSVHVSAKVLLYDLAL